MNIVSFPGLGLEFTIYRVAFTVFGHSIYWYGVIIAMGFLLAALYCARQAPRFGLNSDQLTDMLIFAVPLSIIGCRLYYIIFYLDDFKTTVNGVETLNFAKMVRIWDGGLAIYGGIIAGILTLLVFCKVKKINFFAFADLGVQGLLIGQLVGRWGNFMNVEAYGGETDSLLRMGITVGGKYAEVHPTFLYESCWNLVGLCLLYLMVRKWRKFDGQIFLSYLVWYGFGRSMIEGLRTDSLYFFGLELFGQPVRTSQVLGAISALIALAVLVWQLRKKHTPDELYVNRIASGKSVNSRGKGVEADGGDNH